MGTGDATVSTRLTTIILFGVAAIFVGAVALMVTRMDPRLSWEWVPAACS